MSSVSTMDNIDPIYKTKKGEERCVRQTRTESDGGGDRGAAAAYVSTAAGGDTAADRGRGRHEEFRQPGGGERGAVGDRQRCYVGENEDSLFTVVLTVSCEDDHLDIYISSCTFYEVDISRQ